MAVPSPGLQPSCLRVLKLARPHCPALPAHMFLPWHSKHRSSCCTICSPHRDISPALAVLCHSPASSSEGEFLHILVSPIHFPVVANLVLEATSHVSSVLNDAEHLLTSLLVISVSPWGCVYSGLSLHLFFSPSLSSVLPVSFLSLPFLPSFFGGRGKHY